jgi:prolyl-tRNA synthetase
MLSIQCVQGVPIRVEIGARDVDAGSAPFRWRTGGERKTASLAPEVFLATIQKELTDFQAHLLASARARSAANTHVISRYSELQAAAAQSDGGSGSESAAPVFLAPWKDDAANEARIKADTKYTIRCYPLENQSGISGKKCFYSDHPATHMAIFARAF